MLIRLRSIVYLSLIVLWTASVSGAVIEVSQEDTDISLLERSDVWIGKGTDLTVDKVLNSQDFIPHKSDFIDRGYTTDEAVWVRFVLHNHSKQPLERQLHIDNSMLDNISLYDANGSAKSLGALNRPPYEGIIDYHFDIVLQPDEKKTYLICLFSNSCATYFHLNLETIGILWQKNLNRQLILGGFFSIVTVLSLYNFFLFLFTREKSYLFYTLMMLSIANNHLSYTGMTLPVLSHFLTKDGVRQFAHIDAYLGIYYIAAIIVFLLLFSRNFMHLERFGKIDILIKIQIFIVIAMAVLSSDTFYLIDYLIYLSLFSLVFLLIVAIYLVYKKEKNSIYFMFGIGISLTGHLLWILFNMGLYVPEGGYWYFYEISVTMEAILFSIILAKKLNHTKALTESLATQKVLTKELHHRVKNNLQFIVSLYRLKLKRHLDANGKTMLKEAEQNIHSIDKMHQILYDQHHIDRMDASSYFRELVDELKKSFPTDAITITIEGQAKIKLEQIIYCGIIINELTTNAIKYAFDKEGGNIVISIQNRGKETELEVRDNGRGFDTSSITQSFGLTLVRHLAENELKGKHIITIHNGTLHTIVWH